MWGWLMIATPFSGQENFPQAKMPRTKVSVRRCPQVSSGALPGVRGRLSSAVALVSQCDHKPVPSQLWDSAPSITRGVWNGMDQSFSKLLKVMSFLERCLRAAGGCGGYERTSFSSHIHVCVCMCAPTCTHYSQGSCAHTTFSYWPSTINFGRKRCSI